MASMCALPLALMRSSTASPSFLADRLECLRHLSLCLFDYCQPFRRCRGNLCPRLRLLPRAGKKMEGEKKKDVHLDHAKPLPAILRGVGGPGKQCRMGR